MADAAPGLGIVEHGAGRGAATAASSMPARQPTLPAPATRAETHRLRGPLDHARPDRLPHPPRLRRRPRARVRDAAGRRQLRGDRPRRRRHRLDGEGDARGERGRAGARSAAAARRADRRGRHHDRDQVGLRARPASTSCKQLRAARAARPTQRPVDGRAPPSSARMRCRRKRTATRTATSTDVVRRDAAGGRRARAWPTRSTPSARASPSRPSRSARVLRRGARRSACR